MRLPIVVAGPLVVAAFSMLAWIALAVVSLKEEVAGLKANVNFLAGAISVQIPTQPKPVVKIP